VRLDARLTAGYQARWKIVSAPEPAAAPYGVTLAGTIRRD